MKIFANKNLWKKIVIIFLIINIFNFITPEPVAAGIVTDIRWYSYATCCIAAYWTS